MKSPSHGYVFDYNDAYACEQWAAAPAIAARDRLEHEMMIRMLAPMRGQSVLDIGCGTGGGMATMLQAGLQVTGIDPSPHALEFAARKLGHKVDLHRGFAEALPFDDNTFDHAVIHHTLEFVADPCQALAEAFRVAKDRVFIGILTRHSRRAAELRVQGYFTRTLYRNAQFLTLWEVKRMIRNLMGRVPVSWETLWHFPNPLRWHPRMRHPLAMSLKSPVGPFTGICVVLMPRYKVIPLSLKSGAKPFKVSLTCLARGYLKAA